VGRDLKGVRHRRGVETGLEVAGGTGLDLVEKGLDWKGKKYMKVETEDAEVQLEGAETAAETGVVAGDPACLNDPECRGKFLRDPASDALVDRDFARYLNLPQRALLAAEEANLTDRARTL